MHVVGQVEVVRPRRSGRSSAGCRGSRGSRSTRRPWRAGSSPARSRASSCRSPRPAARGTPSSRASRASRGAESPSSSRDPCGSRRTTRPRLRGRTRRRPSCRRKERTRSLSWRTGPRGSRGSRRWTGPWESGAAALSGVAESRNAVRTTPSLIRGILLGRGIAGVRPLLELVARWTRRRRRCQSCRGPRSRTCRPS